MALQELTALARSIEQARQNLYNEPSTPFANAIFEAVENTFRALEALRRDIDAMKTSHKAP